MQNLASLGVGVNLIWYPTLATSTFFCAVITLEPTVSKQAQTVTQQSFATNCPVRTTYFCILIPIIRCSFQENILKDLICAEIVPPKTLTVRRHEGTSRGNFSLEKFP